MRSQGSRRQMTGEVSTKALEVERRRDDLGLEVRGNFCSGDAS